MSGAKVPLLPFAKARILGSRKGWWGQYAFQLDSTGAVLISVCQLAAFVEMCGLCIRHSQA
jgi:hypothetical protein